MMEPSGGSGCGQPCSGCAVASALTSPMPPKVVFESVMPVAATPSLRSSTSARVPRDTANCGWGVSSPIQMGSKIKHDGCKERLPPGSNASTVRATTLSNSMLRWMLRSKAGKLSSFLNSFLAGASKGNKPCTPRSVWPLPIPFWIDASTEGDDSEVAVKRAINAMVLVLNWLHLKSPAHIPKNFDAFAPLTDVQQTVVERLRRFCSHWLEAGEIAAEDMGRTASKIEDLEGQLAYLSGLADRLKASTGSGRAPMVVGNATSPFPGEPTLAKDIEAHRLKFPGVPAFDPRDWLTDEARVWYDRPLDCSLPPEEHFEEVPHVQVKGNRKEVLKLLRALDDSNRLAIFPEEEIRVG